MYVAMPLQKTLKRYTTAMVLDAFNPLIVTHASTTVAMYCTLLILHAWRACDRNFPKVLFQNKWVKQRGSAYIDPIPCITTTLWGAFPLMLLIALQAPTRLSPPPCYTKLVLWGMLLVLLMSATAAWEVMKAFEVLVATPRIAFKRFGERRFCGWP